MNPTDILWFPVVVAVQFVLTTGFALALSALTVHFRDIRDILSQPADVLVLRDADHLLDVRGARGSGLTMLKLNPFTHLAVSYQQILFSPQPFSAREGTARARQSVSVFVFVGGYFLFDRLRDSFAEEV